MSTVVDTFPVMAPGIERHAWSVVPDSRTTRPTYALRVPRHLSWLIPLGYVVAFVASWSGVIEPDDGSGLPWIGVFALGLPWSFIGSVAMPGDGMSPGLKVVLALAGIANTMVACLIVRRLTRHAKSS